MSKITGVSDSLTTPSNLHGSNSGCGPISLMAVHRQQAARPGLPHCCAQPFCLQWPCGLQAKHFCHLQSKDTNNLITSKTPTHLTLAGSEASNAAHHAATLIAKEKCFDNAPFGLGQKQ
jgi:hypothetical protein